MPSQLAQESPACVGLAVSNLLTLVYRTDTLSVVTHVILFIAFIC